MTEDDKQNLDDLREVERALIEARQALTKAMVGQGSHHRHAFVFHLGFARGRLELISERHGLSLIEERVP